MPIKTMTCYIALCDGCGKEHEYDYTPHWPSAQEAIDETVNISDWWSDGKALLCDDCKVKPHKPVPDQFSPDDCARCGNLADEHEEATAGGAG